MSITVENLSFGYGAHRVLDGVSFTVEDGQLLSVLGPNGVGKSTLFRCMLGLLNGYTGRITIDGTDVHKLSARELAHHMAYIPQSHAQSFNYTVLDMVLMGTAHQMAQFSLPGKKQMEAAQLALYQMGIEPLAHKGFRCLSGGEQQLVLIARALAQQVKIFVMDEPTANLDYGNQTRVLEQVKRLTMEGYTILLSTHNPQHALTYSDAILALSCGRVAAFGLPETMDESLIKCLYGMNVQFLNTQAGRLIIPQSDRRCV
ncbi:MAG: ABC transporter ATP-binding protein [Clostridia bacterium]